MKPSAALDAHREEIRRVVEAHRARNPRVFGSVLDGTDTEASDLDLLIDPAPGMTLFDIGGIIEDLQDVLGVRVDVLTAECLPSKWRARVLDEAMPV